MQPWEVEEIVSNLQYFDSPSWERCRLEAYSTIQSQSSKKIKLKDFMSFPWEKDFGKIDLETEISEDDIMRLREQSNFLSAKMQKERKTMSNELSINDIMMI